MFGCRCDGGGVNIDVVVTRLKTVATVVEVTVQMEQLISMFGNSDNV